MRFSDEEKEFILEFQKNKKTYSQCTEKEKRIVKGLLLRYLSSRLFTIVVLAFSIFVLLFTLRG